MTEFMDSFKQNFSSVIQHLEKEISNLRVGRATPSLVENIMVNSYETPTPLVHLASIATPDPKTIAIQPWDKNLVKEIEKAISQAELGISPLVKDDVIILSIPSLTEETRKEIIKKLNKKLEETRVSIRNNREKIKEQVIKMEKDKEIPEDEKYKMLEELDELVKKYNEQVKVIGSKKETEVMTV